MDFLILPKIKGGAKLKKFLRSTLFIVLFTFIFGTSTFASINNNNIIVNNPISVETTSKNVALDLISQLHQNKLISKEIKLYNFKNKENAVCFILKDNGYIIVSLEDYSISEFSLNSNNKYFTDINKKYIYNGPGEYYEKTNDVITSLINNKVVPNNDFIVDNLSLISKIKLNNKQQVYTKNSLKFEKAASVNYNSNFLPYLVPNYTYNPNGVCGSCASAMFLRYWNDHIDGRYVPSNLMTDDGVALIKTLIPDIEIGGSAALDPNYKNVGSTVDTLCAGVQKYLRNRGIVYILHSEDFSLGRIEECINNARPAIVGLSDDPTYTDHWVVASGYIILNNTTNGNLNFIQVTDGWGGQGTYIDCSYCTGNFVW